MYTIIARLALELDHTAASAEVAEQLHADGWHITFRDGDGMTEPYTAWHIFPDERSARLAVLSAGADLRRLVVDGALQAA